MVSDDESDGDDGDGDGHDHGDGHVMLIDDGHVGDCEDIPDETCSSLWVVSRSVQKFVLCTISFDMGS